VREPVVFLLDEPLSNLDAKLRVQMRVELKKLHDRLGTTAIYVTHDQVEAMTLGDRVVVMRDGVVQQVGEPLELYNEPANRFVAGENRGSFAKFFVASRLAAAQIVIIQRRQIVVDQRVGMDELDRARGMQRRGYILGKNARGFQAKHGADAFATRKYTVTHSFVYRSWRGSLLGHELVEGRIHGQTIFFKECGKIHF